MKTTAYEFISACMAGLMMWGKREDGEIEWVGTEAQRSAARGYMKLFEEGLLPN